MQTIPKNCVLIEGVVASGGEMCQGDVRNGDYRHISPDLYPGSLNVLVEPTHLAGLIPANPYQIIDHEHWDHPVMWWRGNTIDTDGNCLPVIITYEARQPYSPMISVLSREHLRTTMHLVDGSTVRVSLWPWWARAE